MVRVHFGPPLQKEPQIWGVSSAGRAPALQAGGHRFDPGTLHQKRLTEASNEAEAKATAVFEVSLSLLETSDSKCTLKTEH